MPMKRRLLLSYQNVMRIKELYAEKDELGRRVYTQSEIARELGVSETTVHRAVQSFGAYSKVPSLEETAVTPQQVVESQEKLLQMLAEPEKRGGMPISPEVAARAAVLTGRKPPPDAYDRDVPDETGGAGTAVLAEKLNHGPAAEMLNELKETKSE